MLSADAATSYGITPHFVVVDELTHWPARDLWDSLLSSAAKRESCLMLVISNAGYGDSWQWHTREAIRTDPDWYFSRLDGPCASWITPKRLAEQRRLLPEIAYLRLWMNQWTAGQGDALREDDIRGATTLQGPLARSERGWVYVAGLDIGLSKDATALAVLGRHVGYAEEAPAPAAPVYGAEMAALVDLGFIEPNLDSPDTNATTYQYSEPGSGRLRLADLRVWQAQRGGKVSLESVETAIVALNERFGLRSVACDPWQAAYLVERLRKRGIRTESVDQTPNTLKAMATEVLEAFGERTIELYQQDRLMADLRALRAEEKSYGVRLTSPRGPRGHGDTATALALGLLAAKRQGFCVNRINRRLLCWP
jgi:phage terminase large subunit-like protein